MAGEAGLTAGSRQGRVVHHVPGRMRIRFERDVNVPETADQLREALSQQPGVRSVEAHPRTRSVVVNYDAALLDISRLVEEGFPAVAVEVMDAGLGVIASAASGTAVGRGVVRTVSRANSRLDRATGGVVDLRDVMPLTLFGLGIRRLLQGGIEPVPWYNLLYYGFSAFSLLHGQGHGQEHIQVHGQENRMVEPDAIEILRQRFARGEITRAQYRRMLAELEPAGEAAPEEAPESGEPPGESLAGRE